MRSPTKYIMLIFLLLTSSVFCQVDCKSTVIIKTGNTSADIFIDSVFIGEPNKEFSLEKGIYEIAIIQSKRSWGKSTLIDTIETNDCGKKYEFSYNYKEKLLITSKPPDAAVRKENEIIGYTPLKVKPAERKLALTKNGYASKNILVDPQQRIYNVNLEYTGIKESIPFTKTITFKILIGSAIVLGGTAAYFKLEADKKFDKYLETRYSKYLDETDRLDLYSGIAFGALQINFGALLYFFLFD